MNKNIFGWLFILSGLIYGSTLSDRIRAQTTEKLVSGKWVKPPNQKQIRESSALGPKPTIIFYSLGLIILGLLILITPI